MLNSQSSLSRIVFCIVLLCVGVQLSAQYNFSFTHYTSDVGLSQNTITAMLKDRKGYLWLGTREGLNKFDGYNFTVLNSYNNNLSSLSSNRIRTIKEDQWGYIWIKTYDDILYRLNVDTEELMRIPDEKGGYISHKIKELYFLPSGTIWLSTFEQGCYSIKANANKDMLTVDHFHEGNQKLIGNDVNLVLEDKDKNIWILTDTGITQITESGESKHHYPSSSFFAGEETNKILLFASEGSVLKYDKRTKSFEEILLSKNKKTPVSDIKALSAHKFVVATDGEGFYVLNSINNELRHFSKEHYSSIPTNQIKNIYVDRAGEVWLQIYDKGVIHFVPQTQKVECLLTNLSEGQVTNPNYFIFEDENDILWVQPYYGSFSWYDRAKGVLSPFRSLRSNEFNSLFDYGLNHILADPAGVFWLSSNRGNGFYKCTFLPDYFSHYLFEEQFIYSISNEIRSIFEDREQRLWIACKDGKVHLFDKEKKKLGVLEKSGKIGDGEPLNALVYNIFQDSKGAIWLATKRNGIYRLQVDGKNSFTIENFVHKPSDPYSPGNDDFYSITEDKKGRIWAGSYGAGLHLVTEEKGRVRFMHSKNELSDYPIENCYRIRQVYPDSKGNIWVATTEGIVVFKDEFEIPSEISFTHLQSEENKNNLLDAIDISCVYEDTEGKLWFGSLGNGLSGFKSPMKWDQDDKIEFKTFNYLNGMPNNIIYTILEDDKGYLWLTSENSIVKFNKRTAEIESFGKGDEIESVEFSEASAAALHSGELCVGTKSGFYVFTPEKVKINPQNAPIVFNRLQLFNQDVKIGDKHSPLKRHIDRTEKLVLNHKQNVFTIEYATLDMRAPQNIQYAYLLRGFDADWNYVKNKRFATYTSLPPGNYTFLVRSTDGEGVWASNEKSMEIEILPSFWQSAWAKLLYVVLLIIVFIVALYIVLTIYKLKSNVQLEQQITDLKLRFFTDISHELRTPLTLISLPVDDMLKEEDLKPEMKEQLTMVRHNLDRVTRLINQILDFRKVQNNKMRLKVEETDFGAFISSCCEGFHTIATEKNIVFQVVNEAEGIMVWIDRDRFDSIVSNLLSNAFKFTPSGKRITVRVSEEQGMAVLAVIDEGVGIAQDKINFIFDRFFSSPTIKNITQKSTGIGLDLVKKLVELHYGFINVESELNKGSTFEIRFPMGIDHFKEEEVDVIISDLATPEVHAAPVSATTEEEVDHKNLPLILIVEDNDDLRAFLAKDLQKKYQVEVAENGLIGWQKAQSLVPDFIVTDLLMPKLNGLELTEKVKNNDNTSHIPVILLTAVTDMDSKLSGMKVGADDYITKPFSAAFLNARIENLIEQRSKLQKAYRSKLFSQSLHDSFEKVEEQSPDEVFLENLIQIMNNNIENYNLNIDFLASELKMSRTVFFNKLKSLTGFSPVEFVREIRLQRASEYILNTNLNFSEIAYRVGFEDPRYFSRCFKQKFGKTPSEYRSATEEHNS